MAGVLGRDSRPTAWAAPAPCGLVPRGWPLGMPIPPEGAACLSVSPDVGVDPLPTDPGAALPAGGRRGLAPIAVDLAAEGRGVATAFTGNGRWGDTACPDGVTRASRGPGPMGVVRWGGSLRRVLSRRGPPPGGWATDRSDPHARASRPRCPSHWNGGILKEPFLKLCQVRTTCLMANRQLGTWKSYAVLWRTG